MSESINFEKFPRIEALRAEREKQGLEELDIELLTVQAGSQDPGLAEKAKRLLREKWDAEPDKDAKNARTIDLMEQSKGYTEQELEAMLSQAVGIQLTEGCNGNCPFCYFGKKKGVEAKYSFESIAAFLRKYEPLLPRISPGSAKDMVFYYDSDPFDYRDGKYEFLDVYKVWRELRPKEQHFVSTTIPRGGEEGFTNLMKYAIKEQYGKKRGVISRVFGILAIEESLNVRISLARHNTQRVEAVFKKLTEDLLEDGYSEKEINAFYGACVSIRGRFKFLKLGPFIRSHEDIGDVETPACRDGVVITPRSFQAIMMVAPNVYEPSGQKRIEIFPGQSDKQTPTYLREIDYSRLTSYQAFEQRVDYKQIMLPPIFTPEGKEYGLQDPVDDLSLKLGRSALSVGWLIRDLADLPSAVENFQKSAQKEQKYLEVVTDIFNKRRIKIEKQIESARSLVRGGQLDSSQKEKIEFYILLTQTYLAKMDFLADQIEGGQSIKTMGAIAAVFGHVGRKQVVELPGIIEGLIAAGKELKERLNEHDRHRIEAILLEKVGKPFGIASLDEGDSPEWFQKLVSSYIFFGRKKGQFAAESST